MANAPLSERDSQICKSDLGVSRSGFFLQAGLDRFSRRRLFLPVGQITNGKTLRYATRKRAPRGAKTTEEDRVFVEQVERMSAERLQAGIPARQPDVAFGPKGDMAMPYLRSL
jgi:hypothetical protein